MDLIKMNNAELRESPGFGVVPFIDFYFP